MRIIEYLTSWEYNYLLVVICILIMTMILTRFSIWMFNRSLHSAIEKSKVAPTHYHFLKNAVALLWWVFGLIVIIYVVPSFRNLAVAIFASAGVLLAILGLAGQQALSNIVSGIFIVIFKPFHVGDFITIADKYTGTVEDITLRHTVITNFENRRVIIPNSVMST